VGAFCVCTDTDESDAEEVPNEIPKGEPRSNDNVTLMGTPETRSTRSVPSRTGFYVKGLRPPGSGTTRGLVLPALSARRVPKDTEMKYFNAITFFDNVEARQNLEESFIATPSPPPPGTA
jgi:hypothetical protein